MFGLALVLAAAADRVAPHGPSTVTAPATWFGPEDYPASAVREQEQGAVKFALDISATGAVTGCRIVESSGFADLDGQTCASAMQHARFTPAADGKGRPIASSFVQRTRWVLPRERGPDMSEMPFAMWGASMNMATATTTIDVDATGKVVRCKLTRAANTPVDPCLAFPIGKAIVPPTIANGLAIPATVTAMTILSVKPVDHRAADRSDPK